MATPKPTIVLVPGSWHVPAHMQPLTDALSSAGHKTVPIRTPTVRNQPPYRATMSSDAAAVAAALLAECELGNDIVVVMHSYGGIPGSDAVEGLSKRERETKGLKGGVVAMVYMAAFALDVGQCLWGVVCGGEEFVEEFRLSGGKRWKHMWTRVFDGDHSFPDDPVQVFYHDVEPEAAKKAVDMLQFQCAQANIEKQKYAAFKHIPSMYIICEDDQAIPLNFQEMMAGKEGKWTTRRLKTAHSPFLTMPKETAAFIEEAGSLKN